MKQKIKHTHLVLAMAYLSFAALGLPDGAFTVAFLDMQTDLGLFVAHSGHIIMASTGMYSITSALLGRLARRMKLEHINFMGLLLLGAGFVGLGFAPNLAMLVVFSGLCGVGNGMIDASLNAYLAGFGARQMNFLHCFWGAGAAFSPLVMSQMMLLFGWRTGYFALAGMLALVGIVVLLSLLKGVWETKDNPVKHLPSSQGTEQKQYLTRRWHKATQAMTCFFYGGMEYSLVFFTATILNARGISLEAIALFPMVYYICMAAGRVVFGGLSKWLRSITIIRIGLAMGAVGVLILLFTSNLTGMALAGFGLAPVFPSLLHDTTNRFAPHTVAKLVGYEVAALGAGTAVLFFVISQVLGHIALEAMYPISLGLLIITFVLNETLQRAVRRRQRKRLSSL